MGKNWSILLFQHQQVKPMRPKPALISVQSHQVETEILEYEGQALGALALLADAGTIKMDQFLPMVKTNTARVAAGAKYEAQLSSRHLHQLSFLNFIRMVQSCSC